MWTWNIGVVIFRVYIIYFEYSKIRKILFTTSFCVTISSQSGITQLNYHGFLWFLYQLCTESKIKRFTCHWSWRSRKIHMSAYSVLIATNSVDETLVCRPFLPFLLYDVVASACSDIMVTTFSNIQFDQINIENLKKSQNLEKCCRISRKFFEKGNQFLLTTWYTKKIIEFVSLKKTWTLLYNLQGKFCL